MAAVRQQVAFTRKEIDDCLIEKAKATIGDAGGKQLQGSAKVEFIGPNLGEELSATVTFERAGK